MDRIRCRLEQPLPRRRALPSIQPSLALTPAFSHRAALSRAHQPALLARRPFSRRSRAECCVREAGVLGMAYELTGGRSLVTARLPTGDTALHIAVQHGDVELAAALVQKGADILAANRHGLTPWSIAKTRNDADILRLFEEASAAFGTLGRSWTRTFQLRPDRGPRHSSVRSRTPLPPSSRALPPRPSIPPCCPPVPPPVSLSLSLYLSQLRGAWRTRPAPTRRASHG